MKRAGLTKILLLLLFTALISSGCNTQETPQKAKYVFYFIGDGMGYQHVTATQAYLAALKDEIGNEHLSFTKFPITGNSTTYAYNRYITGSAAAGTALSTGSKTTINTIGLNHNHTDTLYSIAYAAQKAGFQVGISTSVSIDHATPAAFYAHQKDRNLYHRISHDLLASGYRFFASGGFRDPEGKQPDTTLGNVFDIGEELGYYFTQELYVPDSIKTSYSSIVYSSPNPSEGANLKYHIDNSNTDVTLAHLTSMGIDILNNPNGFFFMVEGGKIDWASHDNDAASVISDVKALSDAIDVAFEFYMKYPNETLIVVTADHETGGLSIGNKQHGYESNISLLSNQKHSLYEFNSLVEQFKDSLINKPSFTEVLNFLVDELGVGFERVNLSDEHIDKLELAYNASIAPSSPAQKKKNRKFYGSNDPIAVASIQILNELAGIGWTTYSHTGSIVPVYAIGANQNMFSGQMDNTDIPKRIAKAMGINFE